MVRMERRFRMPGKGSFLVRRRVDIVVYSSLHKIDLVAQDKNGTGKIFVQTDHRDAEEVAREVEISVIFALARTLLPRRMPDAKQAVVRYVCMGKLHPALAEVAVATGTQVEAMGENAKLEGVRRRAPADIADEAFGALGKRLLGEKGLAANEEGLAAFEATLKDAPSNPEDEDEIAHWTAVVELAAVAGEVLRAKYGGRWVDDPKDFADIPFLFEPACNAGLVNPVGKAIKFLLHGAAESPRQLLTLVEDSGAPQGPLLFTLKPSHWGARTEAVSEPLFPGMEKAEADIPVVVYGHDQPNTFAIFMRDGKREKELDSLRAQALGNLARIEATVERVDLDRLTFWAVHGGYFAGEKILDVAFMKSMHDRAGSPLLAAAVPAKGQLLVTSAVAGPETILGFMAIARGIYEKNEGGRQLSPTVFLVSEGKITGLAKATEQAPTKPEKKGFFRRWLS
jgi:hypothetical protein